MTLIEELKQTWPSENISPYGEVLVIPSRHFRNEWEPQLENEGVKIYAQAYNGEACLFLKEGNAKPVQRKPKRRWTNQDDSQLKDLHSQHYPLRDIASKLDRSRVAVLHRIQRLGLSPSEANREEVASEASLGNDIVKEFLSASSLLYPSHRRACAYLLREASKQVLEG